MKVQKHNCPSCGAPIAAGLHLVKCDHCGSQLKIASHTGELRQIGQPHVESKPIVRRPPMSKRKKRAIIISIILLIGITAIVLKIYNGYYWVRLVNDVAWSPDGKRIVSIHGQGLSGGVDSLRVWDSASGEELNTVLNRGRLMWHALWSPDGKYLAVGNHDGTIEIWDIGSMQIKYSLTGATSYVSNLAWSPDSTRIASGDDKGTLRVWNAESGETLYSEFVHTNRIDDAEWSPDGRMIATGGWDNTIRVVDAITGKQLFAVKDTSYIDDVEWSADGRFLASGGLSNLVKIIDVSNWKELFSLSGHKSTVHQVGWSPDGKFVASASSDGTVRVWDAASGKMLKAFDNPGFITTLKWSPDGSHLAAGGYGSVRIWDNAKWDVITLNGNSPSNDVCIVRWSADGKQMLTRESYDGKITLWDVTQKKEIHTMQIGYFEAFRRALF